MVGSPETEDGTVLVHLRSVADALPASERRVAETIIKNPRAAVALSIKELAARCETSTTSVVRLYRRVGYTHYKDFRIAITREAAQEEFTVSGLPEVTGDIERNDSLDEFVWKLATNETLSISDTARNLDLEALARAIDLTITARRIDIFGVGASSFVGLDLQQKLARIGRTAICWGDPHSAWTAAATLDSECLAVTISHSGSTTETLEFSSIARQSGAANLVITNAPESPLAEAADVVLATAARETSFRSGAFGSRIAQLLVIDCLFVGVAQASFDESVRALKRTYAVVSQGEQKRS